MCLMRKTVGLVAVFWNRFGMFLCNLVCAGNVWILGEGHSSFKDAPSIYKLSVVLLYSSYMNVVVSFIILATRCRCQTEGGTTESITQLQTYTFKSNKTRSGGGNERGRNSPDDGSGKVAAGTKKEFVTTAEDAASPILLFISLSALLYDFLTSSL